MQNRHLAGLAVLFLAACGGSGGSGPSAPAVNDWVVQAPAPVAPSTIPSHDFGAVAVGDSRDYTVSIQNKQTTPASLTEGVFTSGAFSVLPGTFPIMLGVNQIANIQVTFAPTLPTVSQGNFEITADAGTSPLVILLNGTGSLAGTGSQDVTNYGPVALIGGLTPLLEVDVPADAISLTLEGRMGPAILVGLGYLEGPDGHVYENEAGTGSYIWAGDGQGAFATQLPNTDRTEGSLQDGGGTYKFKLRGSSGGTMNVRAIVERRSSGFTDSVLDLNVFLADGLPVKKVDAPTDVRLRQILTSIEDILGQADIRIGDIDYYDVTDPTFDEVTEPEFAQMLQLTSQATNVRLNLFFVVEALGGGVVGVSPTVDGPAQNGSPMSGVMSVYEGFGVDTIGLIAAHEICHFIGLYHTQESDGSHDFIDDTLDCNPTFPYTPCLVDGGGYLMHWQAVGGTDLSDAQGMVIRGHPHLAPDPFGIPKPAAQKVRMSTTDIAELLALPEGWCGTCATCRKHAAR